MQKINFGIRQNQYFSLLNLERKMLKNLKYEDTTIKKHNKFKYLGCILDEAMSGKVLPL